MTAEQQGSLFDSGEPPPAEQYLHGGAIIHEVRCRSLLNQCSIADYSFNCYVGCAHGCGYCYARFMQRFHPHAEEWGDFVDVRINAAEVLARQLRRVEPGSVFTCSACDGWQPIEGRYRLTRRCCELLLAAGFQLNVLTKSRLVLRDLDIFTGQPVCLGVTLTTPDESWARVWEPGASTVADRIEILRQGKVAGLKTAVMFGPLLPGISDTDEALNRLFKLAAEARVDRVWTDLLNPRPRVWPAVQEVLRRHCPDLYEHYRQLLFEPAYRRRYRRETYARIQQAARNAKLADRMG